MMGRLHANERGASITAVILLLAVLTTVGVIFVSLFTAGVEQSVVEASSTRALHIAEGGAQAATGRLKKNPPGANWVWNDGYLNKALGGGTFDVEVLQYEPRDSTLALAYACAPFESVIKAAGANPARTVYLTLSWSGAADLNLELYNASVADCSSPLASASLIASSATANMPETIRYRIPTAAPATLTYTARVTGPAGTAYKLGISHPDETSFGTGKSCGQPDGPPFDDCIRALIALGRSRDARREIFTAFKRTP